MGARRVPPSMSSRWTPALRGRSSISLFDYDETLKMTALLLSASLQIRRAETLLFSLECLAKLKFWKIQPCPVSFTDMVGPRSGPLLLLHPC